MDIAFLVSYYAFFRGEGHGPMLGTVVRFTTELGDTGEIYSIKIDIMNKGNDVYVCFHSKMLLSTTDHHIPSSPS